MHTYVLSSYRLWPNDGSDDGDDDNDIDYDNLAEDDASLDNYDNGNAYGCDQPAPSA